VGILEKLLAAIVCALAVAALLSARALAQDACRVLDPELAGSYRGGCRDGLAEGPGEAKGSAEYRGEFRAGRKHGRCVKTWANGYRYEGGFVDDRKDGVGTYVWGANGPARGERYEGNFRADRREGFGIYTWPSGDRYEDEWANDTIAGPPTPGMLARARMQKEAEVAMRTGARVCRQVTLGIAERDIVRGVVVSAQPGTLSVRIEEPGRFGTVLNGVQITRGAVVNDSLMAWTPCF
jgi:hypothetical protein